MSKKFFTTAECVPYVGLGGHCPDACVDGRPITQRYRVARFAHLANEDSIKESILKGGSVIAAFTVYQDFESFRGDGVYKHRWGAALGGHAIKVSRCVGIFGFSLSMLLVQIIGWGEDKKTGEPYWLIQNSYGPRWNGNGYFKFSRGTNNAGIEKDCWDLEVELTPPPTPTPTPTPTSPQPEPTPVPPVPVPTPVGPDAPVTAQCTFGGKTGQATSLPGDDLCPSMPEETCLVGSFEEREADVVTSLAQLSTATAFERCYSNAQQWFCGHAFPKYDSATGKGLPLCRSACIWFTVRCGAFYPTPDCRDYPQDSPSGTPANCFIPELA